jgi:hypothetical protein
VREALDNEILETRARDLGVRLHEDALGSDPVEALLRPLGAAPASSA